MKQCTWLSLSRCVTTSTECSAEQNSCPHITYQPINKVASKTCRLTKLPVLFIKTMLIPKDDEIQKEILLCMAHS